MTLEPQKSEAWSENRNNLKIYCKKSMILLWVYTGKITQILSKSFYKIPYQAFSWQANRLILNIPDLQGLLSKNAEKDAKSLQIENNELQIVKHQTKEI